MGHGCVAGCTIVGSITAMGGGTVRDVLIGNAPVFWYLKSYYLNIACIYTDFIFKHMLCMR